jgi:hypothetical protein
MSPEPLKIGSIHAQQDLEGIYLVILDQTAWRHLLTALEWAQETATGEHTSQRATTLSALMAALRQAEDRNEQQGQP